MASWQPTQEGVLQLVQLLTLYQQPGTNQSQIFQQLEAYRAYPDFNNYLAFLFATGDQLTVEVRQSAGLLLKNNLSKQYNELQPDFKAYIKSALLPLLGHATRELRHTAGTIASVIVGLGGLEDWPDLASAVPRCLQAEDPNVLDGALDTLYKVLEDHPRLLDTPVASAGGAAFSKLVVPPLLRLMQSPTEDVRRSAVAGLNLMAPSMPVGLQDNVDSFLQGLFALANDTSNRVRKEVVMGLVTATSFLPDRVAPFMGQLVEYMLASNEHADPAVALAAAEFWTAYLELQLDPGLLRPALPRLIPVLLKNMVFDEYDDEVAEAEAAEASGGVQTEDRDQDLKPFHHRAREHGAEAAEEGADGGAADGDDDDDDEVFSAWNLRKCSAEALDVLSNNYGDDLLPVLLPIVQQRLQDTNWRSRESAILALGAISHGCHQGLQPYLEGMVTMLLPALQDARPMVRIITCWTLGRYSHWLFVGVLERGAAGRPLLDQVVAGILGRMADNNKFVQAAAVSALAVLVETASEGHEAADKLLEPYIKAILEALAMALSRYTRRGVVVTYDALSCTARVLGPRMADPALATIVLPPLVAKFTASALTDKDLLATMECLANVTPHTGRAVEPYAKLLYDRALALAGFYMAVGQQSRQAAGAPSALAGGPDAATAAAAATAGAAYGGATAALANGAAAGVEYDVNFVVLSLDVVSGMAQGLGASIESLVGSSPLVQMLTVCCWDTSADVRQSAFALVGDLATSCVAHLLPALDALVGCALALLELPRITEHALASANNACWSLGELTIKVDPERIAPHAEAIALRMTSILSFSGPGRMPPSILENASITLGRTAWRCSEQLAPHLAHFVTAWCMQLRNIRDGTEKEHAFLGLCRLVRMNPEAALPAFPMLCAAFASWRRVGCEGLRNEMAQILQLYKTNLSAAGPGRWEQVVAGVAEPVRGKLQQMFGPVL
ncbi:hypothetical protein HXX76_004574 [Chlamydomonas incerta]|uniref:Importin N-terminal domain-containing protein n=1 Tax=Chlamydomonas incerta TaxID=51695 RepID=A0A835W3H4_CHLIN|nr:hypothetical protein HXX76_004574 [Chlamydomonas incerta]|eukprot:KAG2439212.1 hypothetical protein HXX76_004574 [Chlamydomonas incerta]